MGIQCKGNSSLAKDLEKLNNLNRIKELRKLNGCFSRYANEVGKDSNNNMNYSLRAKIHDRIPFCPFSMSRRYELEDNG